MNRDRNIKAVIVGTDGSSRMTADRLMSVWGYDIRGFIGPGPRTLLGLPVWGRDEAADLPDDWGLVLAVEEPAEREHLAGLLGRERFITVIAGRVADSVSVGHGCVAFGGAVGKCQLGDFVFIDEQCIVGHHVRIGDYSFQNMKTSVGGGSTVGRRVWIGLRVTTAPRLTIGDDARLGHGAMITAHVAAGEHVEGHPAVVVSRSGVGSR